jgi:tRNA(Ile)-lysidine synthase
MQNQRLPHAGDRVGVAVSGGADSLALLFLMLELREQLGIVLSVVHLNHKLRARASDADEKFVAKLSAKCGLPFHVEQSDVASLAKRKKANLEDTARRARYSFFERLVTEKHVDWVAVAHTADDQAETVLAHIVRGTGLAGLGGIHPIAGHVIRPLLMVRRAELKAYLRTKKQTWREDLTNRDTTKMRARIRRKLLPLLEKQFQTVIVDHLGTLAELAREDDAFLDALAKGYYKAMVRQAGGQSTVGIADLIQPKSLTAEGGEVTEKTTRALSKRLVRLMVEEVKPRAGQLNAEHVRAILNLAEHGVSGKQLRLPGGIAVRREHNSLVFCACSGNERTNQQGESSMDFEHAINLGNEETVIRVPQLGCVFRLRVIDWPAKTGDTRRTGSALDRGALRSPLVLRNWRPGDKLHPIGHRNAHKLKRLLNKKRVARWERHGWPVLTSGGVLAWARGFPMAAEFAANEKTRAGIVIVEEPIS